MDKKKKGILDFAEMKRNGEKITFITSYDYHMASFSERAGLDMLLVGDSLGMTIYGYSSTIPVKMDQMIYHAEAVRRGAPNTFVIGDMPFMSYQKSWEEAVDNAGRFYKEAGCDAIKLEGGVRVCDQISAITDAGMLVMGHIGLTPQSTGQFGGYKAQGYTADSAMELIEDALAVQEAGAFALLLEAVTPKVAGLITKMLDIPVLSIGAGPDCDGQLIIVHDILGIFETFTPRFVKRYASLGDEMVRAIGEYAKEVREGVFPGPEHTYLMKKGEFARLQEMLVDMQKNEEE